MSVSRLQAAAWDYLMASEFEPGVNLIKYMIDNPYFNLGADLPGGPFSSGWVFSADNDGAPFRAIEGTSSGAISLMVYDTWASSTMWHSSSFPNLHVAIYGDPTRDDNAFPERIDGKTRALRIYEKIHPLFHDNSNRIHRFGDLPVISSVAGGGFTVYPVPGGDGMVRLDQIYNIHL